MEAVGTIEEVVSSGIVAEHVAIIEVERIVTAVVAGSPRRIEPGWELAPVEAGSPWVCRMGRLSMSLASQ